GALQSPSLARLDNEKLNGFFDEKFYRLSLTASPAAHRRNPPRWARLLAGFIIGGVGLSLSAGLCQIDGERTALGHASPCGRSSLMQETLCTSKTISPV